MKTFIIDYSLPTGRFDFKVVEAEDKADAVRIFRETGVDGWTGYKFSDLTICKVAER